MKTKLFLLSMLALMTFSCTDAERSKYGGLGSNFDVSLVNCDGTITHKWTSSGKVLSEESSDGYYFKEKGTGKLIEVTGSLIIVKK